MGRSQKTQSRDHLFAAYHDLHRMVRTKRYKLIHHLRSDVQELFDTMEDPHELKNLADDPSLAKVRRGLRKQLDTWRNDHNDLR